MQKMNFMVLRGLLSAILIMTLTHINAQHLTAEQAVAIALENNYSIRLSKLNVEILENNLSSGRAGFLPVIDASAAQNNSIQNTRQEYLDGRVNERDNAKSNSFNAGIGLDWTVFDGLRMFTGYDILKEQLQAGHLQTRLEVENTITDVLSLYYQLVELRQKVKMFEESVALGRARAEIADEKLAIGAGSRLELLQARVDMNADISELLKLNDQITEATIRMNLLLGRNAGEVFSVEDSIRLVSPPDLNVLKTAMEQNNTSILINKSNVEISRLNLRAARGKMFPELGVNMGWNYNNQNSESGFLRSGRSDGFNYGLTASVPIIDKFNNRRERQNARVGIESANLEYETYLAESNAALLSTYSIYSNKLKNIELESENLETAETNFEIANERYRLGELSGIEIREAQQNLLIAHDRFITLVYEARLLEVEMLRLTGGIIPEK